LSNNHSGTVALMLSRADQTEASRTLGRSRQIVEAILTRGGELKKMRPEQDQLLNQDPAVRSAIAELQAGVAQRYPAATFEVFQGEDPTGIYLRATVDVEDTDEVVESVLDRLLNLQVDQGLPVQLVVSRPVEASLKQLKARHHPRERTWGRVPLP
jgi:hypothetical protein